MPLPAGLAHQKLGISLHLYFPEQTFLWSLLSTSCEDLIGIKEQALEEPC